MQRHHSQKQHNATRSTQDDDLQALIHHHDESLEREYEDTGRDTQLGTGGQLLLTQPFVPTFASSSATTLSTTLSILSNVESHSRDMPFPRYTSKFSDINIANDSRETEDIQGGGQSNAELLAWYNSAAMPIYDTLSSPEQQPSGLKMDTTDVDPFMGYTCDSL